MKKVIILLAIFALLGCEKEICWECIATCVKHNEITQTDTTWLAPAQIYCGYYTGAEIMDMAIDDLVIGDDVSYKMNCLCDEWWITIPLRTLPKN